MKKWSSVLGSWNPAFHWGKSNQGGLVIRYSSGLFVRSCWFRVSDCNFDLSEILRIIKCYLVKTIFERVQFQYKGRPSKVANNWTGITMLNCNFSVNLKGFQSKWNIIAQNISGRVLFIIFSFRQRIQNFQLPINVFLFNDIFAQLSLYFKCQNKIFLLL